MRTDIVLISILLLLLSIACRKEMTQPQSNTLQVRYIQQICCGNLVIVGQQEIVSPCPTYQDSLLSAINLDDFDIPGRFQFGDTFSMEYQLTTDCEASCEITCNRHNGIPVRILAVE